MHMDYAPSKREIFRAENSKLSELRD
jgi:hypothetical protein